MKIILFLLLSVVSNLTFAQGEKLISGKIIVADAKPSNVIVLNLTTEKETHSDSLGNFKIIVKVDDLLVFYAPHLDKMRKLIDEDTFNSSLLKIEMTSKIIELDEVVVVDYSHINAYSLGIIPKYIKPLTPAERGKYRSEPRAKEFEENLDAITQLQALYDDDFLEQKLKIEKGMTKAFLFYAVEHKWFLGVVKGKNKMLKTFYLTMLAHRYNNLSKPLLKSDIEK